MGISRGPGIVKDGLILHLDAASQRSYTSGSSSWQDLAGSGSWNASLVDNPAYSTDGIVSLVFDGSTQDAPVSGFQQSQFGTSGTHMVWIKHGTEISASFAGNSRLYGYDGNFELRWGGGTAEANSRIDVDYGASDTAEGTKNVWLTTEWYHVAITHNASDIFIYVDGELDGTGSFVGTGTNTDLKIANGGINAPFDGSISVFMVYDRDLSQSEVQQNYNAQRRRFNK